MRWPTLTCLGAAAWLTAAPAGAEEAAEWEPRQDEVHTMFQLGTGLLALPGAEVCPRSPLECEPGETSFGIGLQALGRIDAFAFGAGIKWAVGLRPNAAKGLDELEREHSRSYFLYEGYFRYYLPRLRHWEWWLGANIGGVVVNDSWSVLADREPYSDTDYIGPRELTIATQGLSLGIVAAGAHWRFAEHWLFGAHFQYGMWILPSEREVTPTLDFASLAGRIDIIDVGLAIAVRLPWPG